MIKPINVHLNLNLPAEETKKRFLRLGAEEREDYYVYTNELTNNIKLYIFIEDDYAVIHVYDSRSGVIVPYAPFYNKNCRDEITDEVFRNYNFVMYSLIDLELMEEGV